MVDGWLIRRGILSSAFIGTLGFAIGCASANDNEAGTGIGADTVEAPDPASANKAELMTLKGAKLTILKDIGFAAGAATAWVSDADDTNSFTQMADRAGGDVVCNFWDQGSSTKERWLSAKDVYVVSEVITYDGEVDLTTVGDSNVKAWPVRMTLVNGPSNAAGVAGQGAKLSFVCSADTAPTKQGILTALSQRAAKERVSLSSK
jgi:hypothetical protein